MKRKLTRSVIANLVWILYCLLVLFAGDLIPLEFADSNFKSFYYFVIAVSLPVSAIWTCLKIFQFKRPAVFIVPATFLSIFILLLSSCAKFMCDTSTEVLFENKNKSAGAYDSDLPIYKTYRVVSLTSFLNYVTKIDVDKMNMSDWIKTN